MIRTILAALGATLLLAGCAAPVSPGAVTVNKDGWICDGTACYPPQSPTASTLLGSLPE